LYSRQLAHLSSLLSASLADFHLPLVQTHGDFNPSNIFYCPKSGKITGLIDWDTAEHAGLPVLDLLHLLLNITRRRRGLSIGKKVGELLTTSSWSAEEDAVLTEYMNTVGVEHRFLKPLLVLYWSRHVCVHIKYRSGPLDEAWENENVLGMLELIAEIRSL
jgi:aminoglycoside phosphotransferase (APT) family kinase protein